MDRLDRTEQRIVGVLIEKQLALPDSYPMSENALVDGCNQKTNRDPLMELATFQVSGAAMALQEKGWVARVEGGGRVPKFKHRTVEQLVQCNNKELAVLAELLLRGQQAPGALKPRVARMAYHASPEEIEALLRGLAGRNLVEQMPQAPRERDRRWRHLLGDGSELQNTPPADPAEPRVAAASAASQHAELAQRVTKLEQQMQILQRTISQLAGPKMGD
jgi:uncharacterized protein